MLFERPFYYSFFHIAVGFLSAWIPGLLAFVLVYQIVQLLLNKRFFLFEGEIREGNSLEHTLLKIAEVLLGFLLGSLVRTKDVI